MKSYPSFLRLNEVMKRTGLSRTTIYELIGKNKFPKQIILSERCVAWLEDDIHDWILARLEAAGRKVKRT